MPRARGRDPARRLFPLCITAIHVCGPDYSLITVCTNQLFARGEHGERGGCARHRSQSYYSYSRDETTRESERGGRCAGVQLGCSVYSVYSVQVPCRCAVAWRWHRHTGKRGATRVAVSRGGPYARVVWACRLSCVRSACYSPPYSELEARSEVGLYSVAAHFVAKT